MKKIYIDPEMNMSIFSDENIVTVSGGKALDDVQSQLTPGEGGKSETIDLSQITWVP